MQKGSLNLRGERMCKCTPEIRTPFCGKPGCEWPEKWEQAETQMKELEIIVHAAIRSNSGMIILGKSHANCFYTLRNIGDDYSKKADDQGFMTSKGRYVQRDEAAKIAFNANQIEKPTPYLFSEDLWSSERDGKYSYNQIHGYYIEVK